MLSNRSVRAINQMCITNLYQKLKTYKHGLLFDVLRFDYCCLEYTFI
jgi:hypothetical protein